MDFLQINTRETKGSESLEVYPDFIVGRTTDLMVRAKSFYAIFDEDTGLWSTDEYDVARIVDHELRKHAEKYDQKVGVKYMRNFNSNSWKNFRAYLANLSDNSHQLDENLTFANTVVKKDDYVSRRLPYAIGPGDCSAWNEIVGTLYDPKERAKIEWSIGAVIAGDSKKIQKFLVLYGPAGTGKSTILNIVQRLFDGYTTSFEAKALGSNNGSFATEAFKDNPLVAIQHDGDLSKIEDNTVLNSIISHEDMRMNEKYKPSYTARVNAFLLMGTNQPVKISDAKSGIIRRLIDVRPTGDKIPPNHYHALMARIEFELGAIAHHCLEVYREMGKNFYNNYRPLEMMFQTDIFFNFVEASRDVFEAEDGISLKRAYAMYKEFCESTGVERPMAQYKMRTELQNYFDEFHQRYVLDGNVVSSYYKGFSAQQFKTPVDEKAKVFSLVLEETTSLLDLELAEQPAQLAKEDGTPRMSWSNVKTTLAEVDTSELHYVKVPDNHIVLDFDLMGDDGEKSLERNLEAASLWPPTYAELSKSGKAVHLHYLWDGDITQLAGVYEEDIEIKTFTGNSSLRRKLSRCNNVPVATINSGLPFKEKKMLHADTIKSEKGLRDLIARNLRKEIHPGTKPSIDFIKKILDETYDSGMSYDVSDLRGRIVAFANNSSNQPLVCLKTVQQMKFQGAEVEQTALKEAEVQETVKEERLVFFDCEVYPNLFVVCWKFAGDTNVVPMINPSPKDIEQLFQFKLVAFNNRRYDNHIMWARYLGYSNEQLYRLSQKIIEGSVGSMFGEAYNLSYADVYDFSSKKQGLKKFQIELGLKHREMDIPWDQPVPPERVKDVVDYCSNDVTTLEQVFKSRAQDFAARQILAELSGLTVNDTTQKHTAKIIFGDDKNPQRSFIYTDLAKEFDGYTFDPFGTEGEKGRSKSQYRGEDPGEGGYVYAEPGMYENVALLDVASMHPTSIIQLNAFGEYTPKFKALLDARLAIKHEDFESARTMLDGKLAPYLGDPEVAKALSDALKIIINIVYGLTSAKFDNPFRDLRNKDNIVAKRGALFMIDLKNFVQERGFTVAHIKTDSIKIPNATPEIIEEVFRFGEKYGYTFEHEATYDRFCLVNDAVYIARVGWAAKQSKIGNWEAVGAQFQDPFVYKSLFVNEPITFNDYCITKQVVQGAMYLDFEAVEKSMITSSGKMHFIGRTGRFVPVYEGFGGGVLYRFKDDKPYAVAGTKGYLWVEADIAKTLPEEAINKEYFDRLVSEAIKTIQQFGPFETFAGEVT